MNYHVLTLFPDMIDQGVGTSITGRAVKNGTLKLNTVNIRDFAQDKRRRVDDYTYGGGAGMLMQAQPVYDAYTSVRSSIDSGRKVRTIYVTPQGQTFTQHMAEELAMSDDLIFLCGHYEGIDERVLEEIVTDYVSIGDYVLTGGELAAMVMIDAISRMVPGVLHNDVSADTESFHGNLLEYPQYTRPEEWHGKRVPQELLTGDPKTVASWRLMHSIERTKERRPDLYERYESAAKLRNLLMTQKLSNMDMISQIDQGHYLILQTKGQSGALLKNPISATCYYSDYVKGTAGSPELSADESAGILSKENWQTLYLRGEKAEGICAALGVQGERLDLYVLTRREKLPVTGLYRPDGKPSAWGIVIRGVQNIECLLDGSCVGTAALSSEGAVEEVRICEEAAEILPEELQLRVRRALLTYALNQLLEMGKTPYLYLKSRDPLGQIAEELGLYRGKTEICRVRREV